MICSKINAKSPFKRLEACLLKLKQASLPRRQHGHLALFSPLKVLYATWLYSQSFPFLYYQFVNNGKFNISIKINALKKEVWNKMLAPETYKEWVSAAWPGSYYIGGWKQGEHVRFLSSEGSGTLATITAFAPYDHIHAKHIAVLLPGGIEDHDRDIAKGWIGSTEAYAFTEQDGITELTITMNVYPEWTDMFRTDWPKALAKLKEICEREV